MIPLTKKEMLTSFLPVTLPAALFLTQSHVFHAGNTVMRRWTERKMEEHFPPHQICVLTFSGHFHLKHTFLCMLCSSHLYFNSCHSNISQQQTFNNMTWIFCITAAVLAQKAFGKFYMRLKSYVAAPFISGLKLSASHWVKSSPVVLIKN